MPLRGWLPPWQQNTVYSVKYFREAICRIVKTLIVINFQGTGPLKLDPWSGIPKYSIETWDPGFLILLHYRKKQLSCHIPTNTLELVHCVEHKATKYFSNRNSQGQSLVFKLLTRKLACVFDIKLFFIDWSCYNLIILIKWC